MVELIHKAYILAPDRRAFAITEACDVLPCDFDLACVRCVQQSGNMQKRRFARTRGGHKRDNFACFDFQVDAAQNVHFILLADVIILGNIAEF